MLNQDDAATLRKIVIGVGVAVLLIAIGIWLYSTGKLGYIGLTPAAALWVGFIVIFTMLAALAFGIFTLRPSTKDQNREDTPSMSDQIESRTLRSIVIGAGVLVMGTFTWAGTYVYWKQDLSEIALPIVIIAGVTVLLLVLGLLTFVFSVLKLSDSKEALGLPSGSIRAVIALMLLVIFAIVAIFLYSDVSSNSKLQTLSVVPTQVAEIKKHIDYVAEVDEVGKAKDR
jgi:magnesium-transporting ATPase (P-type)